MHRSELKILAGAGSWGEQDGGWRKRKEGGRLEEDGEEAGGEEEGEGGRKREGRSRGSGSPGFPERPNDPDVQLRRWLLGETANPLAPGGPSPWTGRGGGKNWRQKRREAGRERSLSKRGTWEMGVL